MNDVTGGCPVNVGVSFENWPMFASACCTVGKDPKARQTVYERIWPKSGEVQLSGTLLDFSRNGPVPVQAGMIVPFVVVNDCKQFRPVGGSTVALAVSVFCSRPPPGLRCSPPPRLRCSPPPGLRCSPPPSGSVPPPGLRCSPPPGLRWSPPPSENPKPLDRAFICWKSTVFQSLNPGNGSSPIIPL